MIKNIIFDFGGVLIEWEPDNLYLSYFKSKKATETFYQETGIKILNREMDRGLSFDIAIKTLVDRFPHYQEPIMFWKTHWHKMLGNIITDNVELLQILERKGYNLYGLTNWSGETFPYVYYKHEFFRIFKDIVVSGREGLIKPEPDIYHLCLKRNNLQASETVFIDDNFENCLASRDLGINAIQFTDTESLKAALKELGVKLVN
ncbi:HAD family hydrolase [Fluviispira vulneris]|uniref:HAD family hydrolase n=1 Tax=Fluviispira vulneris TaxID=2763012 RepID=UPI001647DE2F|nr:HAD family phosphatase [Fluviispira vulneris]